MSVRSRTGPRGAKDDADPHEERSMWTSIVEDTRKCKEIESKLEDIVKKILAEETKLNNIEGLYDFHIVPLLAFPPH
jgi:hypothetical protein